VAPDANDERILKAGASRRRSAYCDTPRANSVLAVSLRLHAPAALANARATTSRPPVAPKHAPSHNSSNHRARRIGPHSRRAAEPRAHANLTAGTRALHTGPTGTGTGTDADGSGTKR